MTVYTASGGSTDLAPIAMVPNESKQVELSPLLKAALGSQELGWVKLSYSGITMELGAQLTVYPGDGHIGVDSPRSLSSDFKSTQRAAAFWVPRGGSARLALANHSTTSIFVKVNCDLLAEELVIPASSTKVKVLTLPDLGPFGGPGAPLACELTSNGAVDALRPVGTVSAPGYSTPVRFYDPTTATFPSLTAVGLQTRAETHITVHNVTDRPIVFTPVLRQATLDTPQVQRLPARPLPPHATEIVDVSALLAGFSSTGISLVTLTLQNAAPKGAFIGSVSQVGGSDHLIEDIPLRTSNPPAFARGSYPLRWDQDYTNQVTVANTSDKTLRIGGSITAGSMVYVFERKDIEPGSTILLDVDKWRRERTPDVNGKLLPLNAPFGKIHWIEMGLGKKCRAVGPPIAGERPEPQKE